jgi:hypothetical protein
LSVAQGPCEGRAGQAFTRPEYHLDSSEEDWRALCDPGARSEFWDPIKYVRLGPESWYVSFGGELRSSYEVYRNYAWGVGAQDNNGYYLNRLMGHADIHFGDRARFFAELQSGLEFGRNGGSRPAIDEDKLDVSQLFLELTLQRDGIPASLKIGRQELLYGEGTLIATRELNVRRPFDGIKLMLQPPGWRLDAFAARPVATQGGFFDDVPDAKQTFWGLWATHLNGPLALSRLDLYYLGLDRMNAQFSQGTARERRHTLGFNAHQQIGPVIFFQEGDLQSGRFGTGSLTAWKIASGIEYSVPQIRYRPVVALQGAITSGGRNMLGDDLETFYPLFPKGLYYGYMPFTNGSLNAIVAHPAIRLGLSTAISLDLDHFSFWRESTSDGVYSQPGQLLRKAQMSRACYIGAMQDLSVQWTVDQHTSLHFLAAYYEVGSYLRETLPPGKNATYLSLTAQFRF